MFFYGTTSCEKYLNNRLGAKEEIITHGYFQENAVHYPRYLGMLIDKVKEKWLLLQPLTETQEKSRQRHIM